MRAIDRMNFEKYAVDPEGEDYYFDASMEGSWNEDPSENETEQDGFYDDEEWPEME